MGQIYFQLKELESEFNIIQYSSISDTYYFCFYDLQTVFLSNILFDKFDIFSSINCLRQIKNSDFRRCLHFNDRHFFEADKKDQKEILQILEITEKTMKRKKHFTPKDIIKIAKFELNKPNQEFFFKKRKIDFLETFKKVWKLKNKYDYITKYEIDLLKEYFPDLI